MPFIQRDGTNKIKGVFANLQAGYAEEFLTEDSSEFLQYVNDKQTLTDELEAQRLTDRTSLPTREQVMTVIENIADLADAKAFLKKLANVVYTMLKNSVI